MSLIRFSHFFFPFLFIFSLHLKPKFSHIIIVTRLFIVLQKQKISQIFFEFISRDEASTYILNESCICQNQIFFYKLHKEYELKREKFRLTDHFTSFSGYLNFILNIKHSISFDSLSSILMLSKKLKEKGLKGL